MPRGLRDAMLRENARIERDLVKRHGEIRRSWPSLMGCVACVTLGGMVLRDDDGPALRIASTISACIGIICVVTWATLSLWEERHDRRMLAWLREIRAKLEAMPVLDDPPGKE